MNILFSLTNLEIGGAQMFVLRLANAIAERLKKNIYIYDHNPEYRQSGILKGLSPHVKIISYTENKFLFFLIWKINAFLIKIGFRFSFREWINRKTFRSAVKNYNIEIVNTHMGMADLIAAEELNDKSITFIPTLHGEYEMSKQTDEKATIERIHKMLSRANGIIYTTEKNHIAIKEELKRYSIPIKKIHVGFPDNIQNIKPVTKRQIGIPENSFVIGMVSRGIPEKGWKEAIESFLIVKKKYAQKPLYLLLIGNGSYLKDLTEEYADKTIHLLQFEKNPLEYFPYIGLFDIGLLPSYFSGESVPNAVIEYLYFGKPVIATSIGEIPKMINCNNKITGMLIPNNNNLADINVMADAISEYIENQNKYFGDSLLAKEAFKKFRIENCVDEYLHFFNKTSTCH